MAEAADASQDVILVPAFVGLGAPIGDAEARGALFGLTRDTGAQRSLRAPRSRACAYRRLICLDAMRADCRDTDHGGAARGDLADTVLRVDGGMVASDWTMQRLADILGAPSTAPPSWRPLPSGRAYLAGLQSGLYPEPQAFAARWALGPPLHSRHG